MSGIYQSWKTIRSIEPGEPLPTELEKIASEKMREAIEQQIIDMLTYGQGLSKQTNYPPEIEHIPYEGIIRTKDVT